MESELSQLARIILFKISKSSQGTDHTGRYMQRALIEHNFADNSHAEINAAVAELKSARLVREMEEYEDVYFITPYGETYLLQPSHSASQQKPPVIEYIPNALEEEILHFFYDKGRNGRVRKVTPTGLIQNFSRSHVQTDRDDISEAVDILVYQKYLSKKSESTRFDPKKWNKYSTEKAYTTKTEYVDLTGKALMHIKKRTSGKPTAAVFDKTTPYAIRRGLETIFEGAKNQILIGDNYIGRRTLDYLQVAHVSIRIITSSNQEKNFEPALDDFRKQYEGTLDIKILDGVLHGRFIIADDKYFVLDHSIKDFGNKPSTIIEIVDAQVQAAFLKLFDENW